MIGLGLGLGLGARGSSISVDDLLRFSIYGDSTAAGDGAPTPWWMRLRASYDPDRTSYNYGVGGQNITTMRDRMIADATRSRWTGIIYDRYNGEGVSIYLDALTTAVGTLSGRFFILPQVRKSVGQPDDAGTLAAMSQINTGIRSAWPNNTFTLAEETAFLTSLDPDATRADFLHRNDTGAEIEYLAIRAWLDAKGW